MPAAPIHHTPIDSTKAWDGGAAEKAFDKKKGDFVKFYAWVDEGEGDADADGTDKEDGWGPHHDVSETGVPGAANEKGFQAAMAALNGAHGGNSVIPEGDRQAVWDHLAAHYKDAGTKADDIPALKTTEKNSRKDRWDAIRRAHPPTTREQRVDDSTSFSDIQSLVYAALVVKLGDTAEDKAGDIDFWIQDLSDTWVVWHSYGVDPGDWKLTYSIDASNVVTFAGDPAAVVEQTEYVPAPEAKSKAIEGHLRCGMCHGRKRLALRTKAPAAGKPRAYVRFSLPVSEMSTEADEPTYADNQPVEITLDNGDAGAGSNVGNTPSGMTIVCPACHGVGSIGIDGNGLVVVPGETDGTPHDLGDGDGDADDVHFYPLDPAATVDEQGAYPYDQVDDGLGTADETALDAAEASDLAVTAPGTGNDYMPQGALSKEFPKENLVRARTSGPGAPGVMLRDAINPADGQSGSVMFGYFSTFNDWYEIDSWFEGQFLERVAPGAYQASMVNDRVGMRVLYDHGFDPSLGNKPLGPITVLREDGVGAYYEVPLLDTDYNRDFLLPALRGQLMSGEQVGSQLGASFRFIVTGETWDRSGDLTAQNPKGLPLRTITAATVLEFGPVTFPASPTATSGVRSTTDTFIDHLRHDPLALARFTERTSYKVVERLLHTAEEKGAPSTTDAVKQTHDAAADGHAARVKQLKRRARLALLDPI